MLEETVTLLGELGHELVERDLGIDYRAFYRAQGIVSAANAAANLVELTERVGRGSKALHDAAGAHYRHGYRAR